MIEAQEKKYSDGGRGDLRYLSDERVVLYLADVVREIDAVDEPK